MALSLFNNRDLFSMPDELFGPLFRPLDTGLTSAVRTLPRPTLLDVKETDIGYEVKADIPGVEKKDIHVSVDNDILTIKVDSKNEKEEEKQEEGGAKWHRVERHSVFMQRSLRMPENADMNAIKATYENGVLALEVGKKQVNVDKEGRRIAIE